MRKFIACLLVLAAPALPLYSQSASETPAVVPQESAPEGELQQRVEVLTEELTTIRLKQESDASERQKLEAQLARLKKENDKLSEQIKIFQRGGIDEITLADKYITHNSAAFRLSANRYGSLRVRLLDSVGKQCLSTRKACGARHSRLAAAPHRTI